MKGYKDYREGKLEAYEDSLYIVRTIMEEYGEDNKLKFIQNVLERHIAWNKEELERLAEQKGATT